VPYPLVIGVCLGVLILLGVCERLARDRDRRALPIRIHVNGTRGKSTVTRLIWGALHEAGIPAVAKTTGTAARLILPDGHEQPVRRLAPPSIREQLWLLRRARRAGARAVVAECMAIQPELQGVSEREMVGATIAVVTNVRLDHTDVMGSTPDEIAESLANTTPVHGILVVGGTLVVGDRQVLGVFERRAARLGTRVVAVVPDGLPVGVEPSWQQTNQAIALAVARELGISDADALEGMQKVQTDPGALSTGTASVGGREVRFVDATAANDPESLTLLLDGLQASQDAAVAGAASRSDIARLVAIYNHRDDRGLRLRAFADHCPHILNAVELVVTGDRPARSLMRFVRTRRGAKPVRFVPRAQLSPALDDIMRAQPAVKSIVFCGNAKGLDVRALLGIPSSSNTQPPIPNPCRVV
jgi:poly-gamma-glutamate synthase PgsB/CapB